MGTWTGKVPTSIFSQLPTAILTSNYPSDVHDLLNSISNVRVHFQDRFIFILKIKAAGLT